MGHPVNVPIRRTMHLSSVIPVNDTRKSVFGHGLSADDACKQRAKVGVVVCVCVCVRACARVQVQMCVAEIFYKYAAETYEV